MRQFVTPRFLLAVALTLSLTSCFDRDKKNDPKPGNCGNKKTTTTSTTSTP